MRAILCGSFLLALSAGSLQAQTWDQCRHTAERHANIDAGGVRLLDLAAGAGSLRIEGKPGLDRVVIRGKACASDAELLEEIKLETRRSGATLEVRANVRDRDYRQMRWRDNQYARLDVTLEVPAGLAAEIDDGSGEIELSNLGDVRIEDGSGEIHGNDLGAVRVVDGSGEIRLVDVRGAVEIEDGSGEIDLQNIAGLVRIEDGSGEIRIRNAQSHVRINDGSGSIDVASVGGDFVVDDDGSGNIRYDDVKGRVDVPRRKR